MAGADPSFSALTLDPANIREQGPHKAGEWSSDSYGSAPSVYDTTVKILLRAVTVTGVK